MKLNTDYFKHRTGKNLQHTRSILRGLCRDDFKNHALSHFGFDIDWAEEQGGVRA